MKRSRLSRLFYQVLLLWAVLLSVSVAFRWWRGFEAAHREEAAATLRFLDMPSSLAKSGDGRVRLAWREWNAGAGEERAIVLLHGNPVAGRSLVRLAEALPGNLRVLVPDLPGFGASEARLGSYAAARQVPLIHDWLEQIDAREIHWVGYSQGSAYALHLADRYPERTRSLTFLAGVGLQEHELLGHYRLNQPVYFLQHAALWSLRWLTPHFGLFDRPWMAPRTAQNFAQTDLRLHRPILERIAAPMLILHATGDRLVPFSAAKAHARLVPQAVFKPIPGGHMAPINEAETVAREIAAFIAAVDAGRGIDRKAAAAGAPVEKPALAAEPTVHSPLSRNLFLGLLLFFLVFVSEDLSCIAGGLLAANGSLALPSAVAACFLGIWVSDIGLYLLGLLFGPGIFKIGFIRRSAEGGRVKHFADAYARRGARIVFLTRFIPGSRVLAYVTAGVLRLGLFRFALWLAMAAMLWTPILVGAAYLVGNPLIAWWEAAGWVVLPLIAAALIALYLFLRTLLQATNHRGRRLLYGRWLRLVRWEFWPPLPVYLPVAGYIAWLALKHRSLTVWAAANPGIRPAGGLVLESKSEILQGLRSASGHVAPWSLVEAGPVAERFETLARFQETLTQAWPVVLKPDVGQRGEGVAVIRDQGEAERYLERNREPVIAQEYVPGREYGVFYYRQPGEGEGRIFSITEKVLPALEGDGRRTLEQLILDDDRAVALAGHYLKVNRERLETVPASGETVQLVELGTHCRGAVFLDGNRWRSEALRAALDRVVARFDGFYFGRFDLRVPSGKMLARGQSFRILELNGVSSESTDIYDPKNSIVQAWRVLCRQWRLAFRIGAANRERRAPVPRVGDILRLLREHRRRRSFEVADAGVYRDANDPDPGFPE